MASTALTIFLLIVASAIGVGIGMFLIPNLIGFLEEEHYIIISIVLVFFTFISLYFMTKSSGGG